MAVPAPRPIAAIVGAGEGLGKALAKAFAQDGFDLALLSRSEGGSALALAAAKEAGGEESRFFAADATKPETIADALRTVQREMGRIECFIYNARPDINFKDPLDFSFDELRQSFDVEVVGAHAAAQVLVPQMVEDGKGSLIFSSATAALRGSAMRTTYSTGKFALRGYAQCLSKAYAKKNIHVAHIRLDCGMDVPLVRQMMGDKFNPDNFANTDDVAASYLWMHKQPKSAWTNELELRPFTEDWTY